MWNDIFDNYLLFLIVFARISGMILFNPFFGRKNIPAQLRVGLAFLISIIITSVLPESTIYYRGIFDFIFACLKELLIGYAVGFVFQMFLSSIMVAGEIIDLQIGVGMSKIYDPHSNVSMPLSGSIFNLMFILIFFASNAHLNFIKIMSLSFEIVPAGTQLLNFNIGSALVTMFGTILVMAVKLSLPIIAIEMICEIGLGILMRTVPQINVFVAGMQLKLLVGLFIIAIILPNFSGTFDTMTNVMLEQIVNSLKSLS